HITQVLPLGGITNFERVDAFDAYNELSTSKEKDWLAPNVLKAAQMNYRNKHDEHNIGSIGCYISHMRAWRMIVDKDLPFALICEDDITMQPCTNQKLNYVLSSAPKDWSIIVVGPYGVQAKHKNRI